jgi:hypothetical protein
VPDAGGEGERALADARPDGGQLTHYPDLIATRPV